VSGADQAQRPMTATRDRRRPHGRGRTVSQAPRSPSSSSSSSSRRCSSRSPCRRRARRSMRDERARPRA
jgi:hypothetical protein